MLLRHDLNGRVERAVHVIAVRHFTVTQQVCHGVPDDKSLIIVKIG